MSAAKFLAKKRAKRKPGDPKRLNGGRVVSWSPSSCVDTAFVVDGRGIGPEVTDKRQEMSKSCKTSCVCKV